MSEKLENALLSDKYFNAGPMTSKSCTPINYLKKWRLGWYVYHLWHGSNRCERCGVTK